MSWRFFGLRNHLVAFLTGGLLVGGGLIGFGSTAFAAATAGAAALVGASSLGANFVGVLTLVFGGAVAVLVRRAGRVRAVDLVWGSLVAIAAFAAALGLDAGSPVSHGGRAARRVAGDGVSALWDLVSDRMRINVDAVRDIPGGVVWTGLMAVALVALWLWAARGARGRPGAAWRAGVAGSAAAALAALALEDSGFYAGTDTALFAAVGYLTWQLGSHADPADAFPAVERGDPG